MGRFHHPAGEAALPATPAQPDNLEGLKSVLLELLVTSQARPTRPGSRASRLAASCRSLARDCAGALERLENVAGSEAEQAAEANPVPPHLAVLLSSLTPDESERVRLQQLFAMRQYVALVEALDNGRAGHGPRRGRPRGMRPLTRRLAARALDRKARGASWSGLVAALIHDLEDQPALEAEDQALLAQLRDLRVGMTPRDQGAYLRGIVARYQAETARPAATGATPLSPTAPPDPRTSDLVFDMIADYVERYGYPPSVRAIGHACQLSPSAVVYNLDKLEAEGRLTREPRVARSLRLLF